MRNATILPALLLLPLTACGTDPVDAIDLDGVFADAGVATSDAFGHDAAQGHDAPSPPPVVTGESPLATCDPEPLWRHEEHGFWFDRASFGITPNAGLLVLSHHDGMSGGVWRTTDGERVGSTGSRVFDAIDSRWHRSVATDSSRTLRVETVVTGDVLFESALDPERRQNWIGATISADGNSAAALRCEHGVGTKLVVIDVDRRAAVEFDVPVDGEVTCWAYGDRPHMAFTPDADVVVFSMPASAALYRLHRASGRLDRVVAHPDIIDGGAWSPNPDLLDLALSPDGTTVATSGADGRVRLWSVDDLTPIGDGFEAGWRILNAMTYAPPHAASPIAWSPAGDLIAHIEPEGDVVVRSTDIGAVLHTFAMPGVEQEDVGDTAGIGGLTFTADGAALAAADMHGASMWGCHTPTPDLAHALSVILDVPETAAVNEPVTFVATHLGSDHFHTHRFLVDDTIVHFGGPDREMTWHPTEPGTYVVTVVVNDGASEVRASRPISIR
jgi:hypothetical protein